MACYIYKHPDTELPIYKVGKANDVEDRHSNLSTAYFNEICESWFIHPTVEKNYSSGMLFFIEKTIHKYLAEYRKNPNREFFTIADIDRFLIDILKHFEEIGFGVRMTRNVDELRDVIDYSLRDIITTSTVVRRSTVVKTHLDPYEHQIPIIRKLNEWYSSDLVSGKLILPPGIGKSYITSFWLRNLPAMRILVLVPYLSIQDDFETAIHRCEVSHEISVVVNNTAWTMEQTEYDIIIYDEAHHMCSKENAKLLNWPAKKKLFLTATERIIDDTNTLDMQHKIFGEYIYQMSILEAIQLGLLADYKIFLTDWTKGLKHVIEQLRDVYHRRKIIMFFNTTATAEAIHAQMTELKFPASIITATDDKRSRRVIIDRFTDAEFHIICNVRCISEGVNIPCIDTVMFMEPRESNIGVIQNIGRGLRRDPNKDFCMVLVKPEMLKHKFIENLVVYDERMLKPRGIVLSKKAIPAAETIDYSIDGITDIVLRYSSRGLNELNAFIKKLHTMDIYCQTDYKRAEGLPDMPEIEYPGFTWDALTPCKDPYEYDRCVTRILELLPSEREKIKSIHLSRDKIVHFYKIDNRIDPALINELKNDKRLNGVFVTKLSRRIIK